MSDGEIYELGEAKRCKKGFKGFTHLNTKYCQNCEKGVNIGGQIPKCYKRKPSKTGKPVASKPVKPKIAKEVKPQKKLSRTVKTMKRRKKTSEIIKPAAAEAAKPVKSIKDPDVARVIRWGLTAKTWIRLKTYLTSKAYEELIELLYNAPKYTALRRNEIRGTFGKINLPEGYEEKYPNFTQEIGKIPRNAPLEACGIKFDDTGVVQPTKKIKMLESERLLESRKNAVIDKVYEIAEMLGIEKNRIKEIKFNSRTSRRLGQCTRERCSGDITLEFHNAFLIIDTEDISEKNKICIKWWNETLAHEVVHIIRSGHNLSFKNTLEFTMKRLGYSDYRCARGTCANVDLFEW